jgi:uncharacterized membrane protein YphA (DoxX/SURF4 family)
MDVSGISEEAATILLVIRLYLGLLFLLSAIGKIRNQHDFVQGVVEYQILPEKIARIGGLLLPWIEIVIALALIMGFALPLAGVASFLLIGSFTIAVTINLQRGHTIRCHCYGVASTSTIGRGTVARNIWLLLFSTLIVGITLLFAQSRHWFSLWYNDWLVLSSGVSVALLFLLLAFCFVITQLLEWAIDVYDRISLLQSSLEEFKGGI